MFEGLVAATLDDPDDGAIKATAIAIMSSTYGFALLRMNNRLRPFMYGPLTQSELVDAVLSIKVEARPHSANRNYSGARKTKNAPPAISAKPTI